MKLDSIRARDTKDWTDHYIEPHTGLLYRQDERGFWYDVEGVRLSVPVFVHGDVLVSLPGKCSRRSFAFADRELRVSPHYRLIQIGRLVLDVHLDPVRYYGDRLAGLGPGFLDFGGTDRWQEVLVGHGRGAFVNEYDGRPLLVNAEEIIRHAGTHYVEGRRFEEVSSASRAYVLRGSSDGVLLVDGRPAEADFSRLTTYGGRQLAPVRTDKEASSPAYADLGTGEYFRLPGHPEEPVTLLEPVPVPNRELFRARLGRQDVVFDAAAESIYTIDDGAGQPTSVRVHPNFPNHLLIATIGSTERIIDLSDQDTLRFHDREFQVAEVQGKPGDRLLGARTVTGESIVLDTAAGMEELRLGVAGDRRIVRLTGRPYAVGGRMLQAVELQQMGGPMPRVLVISEPDLPVFTLPRDLKAYTDQEEPSAFAGNEIVSISPDKAVVIDGTTFLPGTFHSFSGAYEQVVLNDANGLPLHLEGEGHRNELVTELVPATIGREYRLGEHRMIGTRTLTWDQRRGELLFSLRTGRSWLKFHDDFLPIFRRVVQPTSQEADWNYQLFEIRQGSGVGEYVVVEQAPPHRLLAGKRGGRLHPRIITNRDRTLENPEEINQFRKLFLSSTQLVEVI